MYRGVCASRKPSGPDARRRSQRSKEPHPTNRRANKSGIRFLERGSSEGANLIASREYDKHLKSFVLSSCPMKRLVLYRGDCRSDDRGLHRGAHLGAFGDDHADRYELPGIAVGTGRPEHRDEIIRAKPDDFFETLEGTDSVLSAILDPTQFVCLRPYKSRSRVDVKKDPPAG